MEHDVQRLHAELRARLGDDLAWVLGSVLREEGCRVSIFDKEDAATVIEEDDDDLPGELVEPAAALLMSRAKRIEDSLSEAGFDFLVTLWTMEREEILAELDGAEAEREGA